MLEALSCSFEPCLRIQERLDQFFFSTTSGRKTAGKGKYLYTVYKEVGHVYASFISLRLHFHYSLTARFILSGAFAKFVDENEGR